MVGKDRWAVARGVDQHRCISSVRKATLAQECGWLAADVDAGPAADLLGLPPESASETFGHQRRLGLGQRDGRGQAGDQDQQCNGCNPAAGRKPNRPDNAPVAGQLDLAAESPQRRGTTDIFRATVQPGLSTRNSRFINPLRAGGVAAARWDRAVGAARPRARDCVRGSCGVRHYPGSRQI